MSQEFQNGTEMDTKNIFHENINDLIKYFILRVTFIKLTKT